jgi:hypothetical protein
MTSRSSGSGSGIAVCLGSGQCRSRGNARTRIHVDVLHYVDESQLVRADNGRADAHLVEGDRAARGTDTKAAAAAELWHDRDRRRRVSPKGCGGGHETEEAHDVDFFFFLSFFSFFLLLPSWLCLNKY